MSVFLDKTWMERNPAIINGVIGDSAPPLMTTSVSSARIERKALPMASVLAVHPFERVWLGPLAPV